MNRQQRANLYVRVCRDSGFGLSVVEAAKLTAKLAKCHPLDILGDVGFDNLERIANGSHPASQPHNTKQPEE